MLTVPSITGVRAALNWKIVSTDTFKDDGHATFEARVPGGFYRVVPFLSFPAMRVSGYCVDFYGNGDRRHCRHLTRVATADEGRVVAERDHHPLVTS
jgi:hypothetical protein